MNFKKHAIIININCSHRHHERKRVEIELQKAHELLQIQSGETEDVQARLKAQTIHDSLTGKRD
jgi:hypothetical protein